MSVADSMNFLLEKSDIHNMALHFVDSRWALSGSVARLCPGGRHDFLRGKYGGVIIISFFLIHAKDLNRAEQSSPVTELCKLSLDSVT